MAAPIRFLFDFISPYAYLGWTQIGALAERHGREVSPEPVLFAALLGAWGHKGPAEIPPKRLYVFKDTLRHAHRLGLPFGPPPAHPFNPLLALRVTSLVDDAATRSRLVSALFREVWGGGGRGVTEPSIVADVASSIGLDGPALVEAAEGADAKQRVRAATERAIAEGAFGVPSVVVDGELFWGLDAFGHVEAFLRGEDKAAALAPKWKGLPAGALRKEARAPGEPPSADALRARAKTWIDAWNRKDLDAIVDHYADDVELCSPKVVVRTGARDGWLRGKDALRAYFAKGLEKADLHFELVDVTIGVGAMTVVYRREDGTLVTDTSEHDGDGRIRRMVACYG